MLIKREDFNLLDKTVLGRAVFQPPFKASAALQNEARFVHILKGNTRLYSAKNRFDLKTGDSLLMKCENFVNNWFENEDGAPSEVIVLQFYPEVLKFIYDNQIPPVFSSKNEIQSNPVEKIEPNQAIDNYIGSLRYYLNNRSFMNDGLLKLKIQELIHILVSSDDSGRIRSILGELFQVHEYEFKEIIHSHLFEDLSLQDLAFFAGLSLSSFKRKFKAVFETSPTRYIKTKRLEKAQNLLQKTNLRISDIAYDCGFNDLGYFSKSFHVAYNYSPSEYRKMHLS